MSPRNSTTMPTHAPRARTLAAVLLLGLLGAACASGPRVERATLDFGPPFEANSYMGLYSFDADGLHAVAVGSGAVDLAYYFDTDDASQGALIGFGDPEGSIYPLGHLSWEQLADVHLPPLDEGWIVGILPLSVDRSGLAFWLETSRGELMLVRIPHVEATTFADRLAGTAQPLELEWLWPPIPRLE